MHYPCNGTRERGVCWPVRRPARGVTGSGLSPSPDGPVGDVAATISAGDTGPAALQPTSGQSHGPAEPVYDCGSAR